MGLTLSLALALALHAALGLLLTAEHGAKTQSSRPTATRSTHMTLRVAKPIQLRPAVVNVEAARLDATATPMPAERPGTETAPRQTPTANAASGQLAEQMIEQLVVLYPDAPIPSATLRLRALVGLNSLGQWEITDTQSGRDKTAFVRSLRDGLEALNPDFGGDQTSTQAQLCLELLFEEQQAVKVKLLAGPERCLSDAQSAR